MRIKFIVIITSLLLSGCNLFPTNERPAGKYAALWPQGEADGESSIKYKAHHFIV